MVGVRKKKEHFVNGSVGRVVHQRIERMGEGERMGKIARGEMRLQWEGVNFGERVNENKDVSGMMGRGEVKMRMAGSVLANGRGD